MKGATKIRKDIVKELTEEIIDLLKSKEATIEEMSFILMDVKYLCKQQVGSKYKDINNTKIK